MDTAAKLFRGAQPLTAVGLGEPSVTLIEFGVRTGILLAESFSSDPITAELRLERVTYLFSEGDRVVRSSHDCVALQRTDSVTVARNVPGGRVFPVPSVVPYYVVFIPSDEYRKLSADSGSSAPYPVTDYVLRRFGKLPGFYCDEEVQAAPQEYATARERMASEREILINYEQVFHEPVGVLEKAIPIVDFSKWALALKTSTRKVRQTVFSYMAVDLAKRLEEEMEYMGPVRLCDAEAAQNDILSAVNKLA